MKISLRTPDVIRRLADRFDPQAPEVPHAQRLRIIAAMFGYDSWESLIAQCSPDAPHFTFDQDMPSTEARQIRWLEMARQVSRVTGILLPTALNLVRLIQPTSRLGVTRSVWIQPNPIFSKAFLEEGDDLYWLSSTFSTHPFTPPGTFIAKASRLSDIARNIWLHSDIFPPPDMSSINSFWVLAPAIKRQYGDSHLYFRKSELVEIAPIPFGSDLMGKRRVSRSLKVYLDSQHPGLSRDEQLALFDSWNNDMRKLLRAAELKESNGNGSLQFTLGLRAKLGESWHWPIKISEGNDPKAVEYLRDISESTNLTILDHFGVDPDWYEVDYE